MVHRKSGGRRGPESWGRAGGPVSWGGPRGEREGIMARGSRSRGKGGEKYLAATPTLDVGVATGNIGGAFRGPHRVRELVAAPDTHHRALSSNRLAPSIPTMGGVPPVMVAIQVPIRGRLVATTMGGGRGGGGGGAKLALKRRHLPLERRHLVSLRPARRGRGKGGGGSGGRGKHHTSGYGGAGERANVGEVRAKEREKVGDSFVMYHMV